MLVFLENHFSEILSFIGGCVTGGLVVKIRLTRKQNISNDINSNEQTGNNVSSHGAIAAGVVNAPINVYNAHPLSEPEKIELSEQAKSIICQFVKTNDNLMLTRAPNNIVGRLETEKASNIEVTEFLDVNGDLDCLTKLGYLERQNDTNLGRKYTLTSKGKRFALNLP